MSRMEHFSGTPLTIKIEFPGLDRLSIPLKRSRLIDQAIENMINSLTVRATSYASRF